MSPGGPLTWYFHSPDSSCFCFSLHSCTNSLHFSLSLLVMSCATDIHLSFSSALLSFARFSRTLFFNMGSLNSMSRGLVLFSAVVRPSLKTLLTSSLSSHGTPRTSFTKVQD